MRRILLPAILGTALLVPTFAQFRDRYEFRNRGQERRAYVHERNAIRKQQREEAAAARKEAKRWAKERRDSDRRFRHHMRNERFRRGWI